MELIDRFRLDEVLEAVFGRKRIAFVETYALEGLPAIILQCLPATEISFDLQSSELHAAMKAGGGSATEDGYWNGFKFNGRPDPCFEGLTSSRRNYSEKWATELHVDGSLTAGLWEFLAVSRPNSKEDAAYKSAVADFYANAFKDFAFLTSQVYEAAKYKGEAHLTCTMHQANQLPLIDHFGRVLVSASKRETVRWPNQSAALADLGVAGDAMAERFLRLYGKVAHRQ